MRCASALVPADSLDYEEGDVPRIGQILGGYLLLEEIGRGSAGVVFRASQEDLQREVAVKIMRSGPLATPAEIARFRQEALAAARLRHPNIVPIFEIGESRGWLFLALGLINGVNLAERLADGWPTARMAARWVRDAADAVDHAHSRGVIHRDLKPGNVLIDKEDQPHITDFGIAKILGGEIRHTATGTVLGTLGYLAPEQASGFGGAADERTDVYGLGAILYHCLTGRPPLAGEDGFVSLRSVIANEPDGPRSSTKTVPVDLDTICLKCLCKDPSGRYAGADELRDDLDRFLRDEPIQARRIGPAERLFRWSRRNPTIAILATLLTIATLIGVPTIEAERRKATQAAQINHYLLVRQYVARGFEALEKGGSVSALAWFSAAWARENPLLGSLADDVHRLRLGSVLARAPRLSMAFEAGTYNPIASLSPDGTTLAVGDQSGTVNLWDTKSGAKIAGPWSHGLPVNAIAWRSDGRSLAISAGERKSPGMVALWELESSKQIWRNDSTNTVNRLEFSPNGSALAVGDFGGDIQILSTFDGHPLARLMRHANTIDAIHFSPDGLRILSASRDGTAAVWEWTSSHRIVLARHGARVRDAAFSPDGKRFATASDDGTAQIWDSKSGIPIGPRLRHRGRVNAIAFSPNGECLASASNDGTARLWDAATGAPIGSPLVHEATVWKLAFAPDGDRLMTGARDGAITIWNTDSGRREGLSITLDSPVEQVFWDVDGLSIFASDYSNLVRRWALASPIGPAKELSLPLVPSKVVASPVRDTLLVSMDGAGAALWNWRDKSQTPIILNGDDEVHDLGFSSDGLRCFTASERGVAQFWDANTGKPIHKAMIHGSPVHCGCFSPDGTLLAAGCADGTIHRWDVSSCNEVGNRWQCPGSVLQIVYSPNGRLLASTAAANFTQSPQGEGAVVRIWDFLTGMPASDWIPFDQTVNQLGFSSDSSLLVLALRSGSALVYDVRNCRSPLLTLTNKAEVLSAVFSPNGRSILTGGNDGVGRLWDVKTGRMLRSTAFRHGRAMSWSPGDGRWLLSAGRDLTIQVWDSESWDPILAPPFHDDMIRTAAFGHDRRWIATGGLDKRIRIWNLPIPGESRAELLRQATLASNQQIDESGSIKVLPTDEYLQLWRAHPQTSLASDGVKTNR